MLAQRSTGTVIAGHTRFAAAKRLGLKTIPVVWLDLEGAEADLYSLADNKLSELAGWDTGLLAAQFEALRNEDLTVAGFSEDEFDRQLAEIEIEEIETSAVTDRFWLSISGPLRAQADVLEAIRTKVLALGDDVEIQIGTTDGAM